ncbi:beta-ketoacyl-[acyl-carrier-protein] synthase family protein [Streptomyces sp. NBC_01221]|uniref:beta-ketoacyl-[acyl-carrier-protein] synthase family protein n=1 Tax=unclassified Streptomyces TaxID=2593676 RepID=UPI00224DEF1A|nr:MULTISPECIES: beta-ketoacyl-[acyl-carrier-protein] synthase family protein [unclassified Streptomyces]WSP53286.1 beta-ketoacyl-[acyl-carrier-protein] synthase family protein [Streptomyces sp. NBC_01241]WSU26034.1 beta-ketoacyl-[acyl-carrier-protein] synthase family protein [Streptomyces sp. NBC_01108]MCX4792033.1 beta-ketoacyl-[acyl-carrier-protein] synthase family protein [Streptomyces sp. NBC_01221]MCX4799725.1 beta-ketoacyl-[acyl-carrier-protein] synthase family protein [Streptomyces sp. 
MTTGVVVTGLGLVTAAGVGTEATWRAVCAGVPTAATDPALAGLPVDFSCRVPDFDARALLGRRTTMQYDRFVQLGLIAAQEAVADAGLDPATWDGARVGVVVGCGVGGAGTWETQYRKFDNDGPETVSSMLMPMLIPNMVAGHLGIRFRATGPNLVTATACASGATAIGVARDMLRQGVCDIVLTGGTDAAVVPLIVTGFSQMRALSTRTESPAAASRPFDAGRDGFVIGEGSGILVLERADHAEARGARVRARLVGYGASADAYHATAPDPTGTSVERAIRAALAEAGAAPSDVDHVNAHGTSTPLNDLAEARVLARCLGTGPAVTSAKGTLGHTLGAAGAIEAALTVLTLENGLIPPTANLESQDPEIEVDVVAKEARRCRVDLALTNSFGFGGQNVVLAFAAG